MKKLMFMIGFALMLAGSTVGAQVWDGNDFTETCTQEPDEYNAAICSSVVIGIAQAGINNRILCIPGTVTTGQTLEIAANYIADHPEERHIAASELIVASLIEAFPCPPQ